MNYGQLLDLVLHHLGLHSIASKLRSGAEFQGVLPRGTAPLHTGGASAATDVGHRMLFLPVELLSKRLDYPGVLEMG